MRWKPSGEPVDHFLQPPSQEVLFAAHAVHVVAHTGTRNLTRHKIAIFQEHVEFRKRQAQPPAGQPVQTRVG